MYFKLSVMSMFSFFIYFDTCIKTDEEESYDTDVFDLQSLNAYLYDKNIKILLINIRSLNEL